MAPVIAASGLAGALVVLAVVAAATARRPTDSVADREIYLDRWARLHGGVDPRGTRWLQGWLAIGFAVARPLARRGIHPDVLTLAASWVAAAVVVTAWQGGRWLLLAAWLLVLSGLGDTLDGAVAIATGRTSRWGYVLDSVVDRVNDLLYLVAIVLAGAPGWLAALTGALVLLLEYTRARAGNAGGSEVGTITVGERAMRVILPAVGLHWGGLAPGVATQAATGSAAALGAVTLVGWGQLLVAVRRDLRGAA